VEVNWRDLKERIDAETKRIMLDEPVDVKRLFAGIFPYNVGVDGQYFTTICFVWSSMQGLGFTYVSNGLLRVLNDPDFTLEQCKKLLKYTHVMHDFLGFAGLETLYNFTRELFASFDSIRTKEELCDIMISYFKYVSRLYGWIHQRFPWGIGYGIYRTKDPEEIKRLVKDLEEIKKLYAKI
jgi:hypothetical protein